MLKRIIITLTLLFTLVSCTPQEIAQYQQAVSENPCIEAGLNCLPFAPPGLSNCDEMNFYRQQWGLPDRFSALGWRESNCRNEDSVRTFCCHGYWQLYVSMMLADQRAGPRFRDECQIFSASDVNSDDPLDKQRQACGTAVLYSISGYSPWSL